MATRLEKTIKRELELDGNLYTVAIGPEGIKMTPKGGRKGTELTWRQVLGSSASPESAGF